MSDFTFHPAARIFDERAAPVKGASGPLRRRPRDPALRLHGKSTRSGGAGLSAQGRLEIRHHDGIVFLGRWTIKPAPNSGMPLWQDRFFNTLSRQAANTADFFSIPSDRVVELGAQVTV